MIIIGGVPSHSAIDWARVRAPEGSRYSEDHATASNIVVVNMGLTTAELRGVGLIEEGRAEVDLVSPGPTEQRRVVAYGPGARAAQKRCS